MPMKSIIKRLRKIRSSGRKTQHRHSNLRWSSKQNKSRKNIMMRGGIGGNLKRWIASRRSSSNDHSLTGWNCKCRKVPDDTNVLTEDSSSLSAASSAHPPLQLRIPERGNGYTGLSRENFTVSKDGVKLKSSIKHPLPEEFKSGDIITQVNGKPLNFLSIDGDTKRLERWDELTKGNIGDKVNFIVMESNLEGGFISINARPTRSVNITLIAKSKGGRKTTYRRKKDVSSSRRKMNSESHNKKRKVMVGGGEFANVLEFLNNATHELKILFIKNPDQSFSDNNVWVRLYRHYNDSLHNSDEKTEILNEIYNRIKSQRSTSPSEDVDVVDVVDVVEVDGAHHPPPAATDYSGHNAPDYHRSHSMRTSTVKPKMSNESSEEPISKKQNVMCECTKKNKRGNIQAVYGDIEHVNRKIEAGDASTGRLM